MGPSVRLLEQKAREASREIEIEIHLIKDAMMILIEKGDAETHNRMALREVETAARSCDAVVLAQGSMTVLLPPLGHIQKPVLTSPRLGIEAAEERYQRALTQLSRKIIVLDDDPTGVQTVHDVIVSTSWSQECVLKCFRTGPPSALS